MVRIAVAEDEREFRDTCAGFIRRYCEENGVQAEVTVFEDRPGISCSLTCR